MQWLRATLSCLPPPKARWLGRNAFWKDMHAHDIISMPDSWKYPLLLRLGSHVPLSGFCTVIDSARRPSSRSMVLRGERYTSPSAQTPAYEWALSDANPPHSRLGLVAHLFHRAVPTPARATASTSRRTFNQLLMSYAWW